MIVNASALDLRVWLDFVANPAKWPSADHTFSVRASRWQLIDAICDQVQSLYR